MIRLSAEINDMKEQQKYRVPQFWWTVVSPQELICDSYNSEIEDFEYEEIDWDAIP